MIRSVVFGAALACALSATAVEAQLNGNGVCTALGYCASFNVEFDPYDPLMMIAGRDPQILGGTRLRIGVRNLQGVAGMPDPGFWNLLRFSFTGLSVKSKSWEWPRSYGWYDPYSDISAVGGATNYYSGEELLGPVSPRLNAVFEAGATEEGRFGFTGQNAGTGIAGCALYRRSTAYYGVSTCGQGAFVEFSWLLPGVWEVPMNNVQFSMTGGGANSGDGLSCTIGIDCQIVPEPSTYLLMLTGLLGLGFVAWRRKDETLA